MTKRKLIRYLDEDLTITESEVKWNRLKFLVFLHSTIYVVMNLLLSITPYWLTSIVYLRYSLTFLSDVKGKTSEQINNCE